MGKLNAPDARKENCCIKFTFSAIILLCPAEVFSWADESTSLPTRNTANLGLPVWV